MFVNTMPRYEILVPFAKPEAIDLFARAGQRVDRMLAAQIAYCTAGQPAVLTPFLLMGAMSPVTIPAELDDLVLRRRRELGA